MPFELSGASTKFQRLMNYILTRLNLVIYLNDIGIGEANRITS